MAILDQSSSGVKVQFRVTGVIKPVSNSPTRKNQGETPARCKQSAEGRYWHPLAVSTLLPNRARLEFDVFNECVPGSCPLNSMEKQDLVERMLRAIRRIILKTSHYSRSLSRHSGLTLPQLLCLRAIRDLSQEKDEVTAAQVSSRVGLAAPTVSRILERMERAQLIERIRNSPDRRRVLIHLTETGKQRLDGIPTPLQEQFVDRVTSLAQEEQWNLLASLEQVVELMEAADLDAEPVISAEFESREDRKLS